MRPDGWDNADSLKIVSGGVKTDGTSGLKANELRNSTDHRSGLSMSVARGNSHQLWWVADSFGLIWKKEETMELILKRKRLRGSDRTADSKLAIFPGFRVVAERKAPRLKFLNVFTP